MFSKYGPQGWWPTDGKYHKNNYSPKTQRQKFEICLGAILTQNTSWRQAEKAILNLKKIKALKTFVISS